MPDNPSPAAQPESSSEPVEFNFDHPAADNPRMKRRSLKGKASGLKPVTPPPAAARELEREAPPLPVEKAVPPAEAVPAERDSLRIRTEPATRVAPIAPPRTTPSISTVPAAAGGLGATVQNVGTTTASSPLQASSAPNSKPTPSTPAPKTVSAPAKPASPHGTRPATLYYSSPPKKEIPSSMKPTPNASQTAPSSSPSSSTSAAPASVSRAATVGAVPTRSATPIDYRANVERQSREQKSVGNILAYFVYGLIAVFLLAGGLAIYGSVIIFDKLHDQSATLSDLDARYAVKVNALNTQITATQDTLAQAQAQIARQQELINRQQEDLNRLIAALNDNANAIKAEKQSRTQETAALRARLRDLEYEYRTATPKP